jgi:hypothetical protein
MNAGQTKLINFILHKYFEQVNFNIKLSTIIMDNIAALVEPGKLPNRDFTIKIF